MLSRERLVTVPQNYHLHKEKTRLKIVILKCCHPHMNYTCTSEEILISLVSMNSYLSS